MGASSQRETRRTLRSSVGPWARLLVIGAAVALVVVDITVVNVALPRVLDALRLSVVDGAWINTAYSLTFAALLIALGRVGDRWGRRPALLLGLGTFALGSLVAARADGLASLIVGRVVQGVGAAAVLPGTLSEIHASFEGRARHLAFGLWGAVIAGAAAIGPVLGGWIALRFGWRWVFAMNVPAAFALALGVIGAVPPRSDTAEEGWDLPGTLLASSGLVAIIFGLIEGPRSGWILVDGERSLGPLTWRSGDMSPVPWAIAIGIILLAAFVRLEKRRRQAEQPVLFDLSLFRIDSFARGNLLALLVGLGEFGIVFVVPLFVQAGLALDTMATGRLFLAMAVGGFVAGPVAGALTHVLGSRRIVQLGLLAEVAGVTIVAVGLRPDAGLSAIATGLFVYGLGLGAASAQLASYIMRDVDPGRSGQAAGMQSTVRQVGAALGVALLGSTYVSTLVSATEGGLRAIRGLTDGQIDRITERIGQSSGWYVAALRAWTPDFAPVVDAIERAIAIAARASVMVALLAFVCALWAARRMDDGRRMARGHDEETRVPSPNGTNGVGRPGLGHGARPVPADRARPS